MPQFVCTKRKRGGEDLGCRAASKPSGKDNACQVNEECLVSAHVRMLSALLQNLRTSRHPSTQIQTEHQRIYDSVLREMNTLRGKRK